MPKPTKGPARPHHLGQLDKESGLIVLTDIYDRYASLSYEEATSHLHGLAELIQHHPSYQDEVRAIRQIMAGERVLNTLRQRAYSR